MYLLRDPSLCALLVCQTLTKAISAIVLVISVNVASLMLIKETLFTLPITVYIIGTFCFLYPAAYFSKRFGRKATFIFGAIIGIIGATCICISLIITNFWLFCFGTFLIGIQYAPPQYFRFAAIELFEKKYQASALSLVLFAGVFSAILGAALAFYTKDLLPISFLGVGVTILSMCAIQVIMLRIFYKPEKVLTEEKEGQPAALKEHKLPLHKLTSPVFTAISVGALGSAIMIIIMNSAVIACQHDYGLSYYAATQIIQWHIIFMYFPSLITGKLIERYGFHFVCLLGGVFYAAQVLIPNLSTDALGMTIQLILLGIGWNLTYLSSTYYLSRNTHPNNKSFTQGINDTIIYASNSSGSLLSAVLLPYLGWVNLNFLMVCILAIIILILLFDFFKLSRKKNHGIMARS